jgi:hypothetical protein
VGNGVRGALTSGDTAVMCRASNSGTVAVGISASGSSGGRSPRPGTTVACGTNRDRRSPRWRSPSRRARRPRPGEWCRMPPAQTGAHRATVQHDAGQGHDRGGPGDGDRPQIGGRVVHGILHEQMGSPALRGTVRIRAAVGRHPKVPAGWNLAARRSVTRRCHRGLAGGVRGSGRAARPGRPQWPGVHFAPQGFTHGPGASYLRAVAANAPNPAAEIIAARRDGLRANMGATLRAMKAAAESSHPTAAGPE